MLSRGNNMVKWLFDRTLSLLAIVVLLPILLLVAIVILVANGAPVMYVQERIGQDGKPFKLIKFRTMHGDEKSPIAASELNRITRVGRWLRRTKIDELPELLNIFVGDMSFVGPRPDVAGYADKLEGDNNAGVRLEHILAFGVADAADDFAHSALHVDITVAGHLAADHHKAGGDEGLDGHVALRVVAEELIEETIGNLVGHFVGMAFGNGFGCEEIAHAFTFLWRNIEKQRWGCVNVCRL